MKKTLQKISSYKYLDILLLSSLIVFIFVCNVVWINLNIVPPHWDMARHLWNSLIYQDYFSGVFDGNFIEGISKPFIYYNYYPPLLYLAVLPFYLILGASIKAAVYSNIIYITILVFSTYGIGKYFYNRYVGLLSALFVFSTPMMITQLKEFQLDAPLAAMVAISIYFLLMSDSFRNKKYSIWFGVCAGLGMLLKWTYAAFLIAPVGYILFIKLFSLVKSKKIFKINSWVYLLYSALIAVTIFSPWYVRNRHQIKIDFMQNGITMAKIEGDPTTFPENLYWMFNNLINNQLYLILFILFVLGLVFTLFKKEIREKNSFLAFTFFVPFIIFVFTPNKDARYTLSLIPVIAIISLSWLTLVRGKLKAVASLLLLFFFFFNFYIVSFGSSFLPKQQVLTLGGKGYIVYAQNGYIIGSPSNNVWPQEEIIKEIKGLGGNKFYYGGLDSIWFNSWGYMYYSKLYKLTISSSLSSGDFVILRMGQKEDFDKVILEILPGMEKVYISEYYLQDNSIVRLYKIK